MTENPWPADKVERRSLMVTDPPYGIEYDANWLAKRRPNAPISARPGAPASARG